VSDVLVRILLTILLIAFGVKIFLFFFRVGVRRKMLV
jgi:hypothetical protein